MAGHELTKSLIRTKIKTLRNFLIDANRTIWVLVKIDPNANNSGLREIMVELREEAVARTVAASA